jgi:putative transposase
VARCEIKLNTNIYFSNTLEEHHGDFVQVAFDMRNPDFIWVYDLESGALICRAEWNANQTSYFPKSFVQQGREKRADGRLKRLDIKRDEIEAERDGIYAIDQEQSCTIELASTRKIKEKIAKQFEDAEVVDIEPVPVNDV